MTNDQKLDLLIEKVVFIEENVSEMKKDMVEVKEEVSLLKEDVSVLKKDMVEMKEEVSSLKEEVSVLKKDMTEMKEEVSSLKEDVSFLKIDVSVLKKDMADVKSNMSKMGAAIANNYEMLEEFYVYQKEFNARVIKEIRLINGKLEMHDNQIARNTEMLKEII